MAKITYQLNNKKYYEVYAQGCDPKGKRIQKRARFDNNGNRICTIRIAEKIEYQLKKEVEQIISGVCLWTWEKWHNQCLDQMKLTHKRSTIMGYDGDIKKWLSKEWNQREMTDFKKSHVIDLIFKELPKNATPNRRHTMLRGVRRIFELAIEEGIIAKNPATGIRVKVPQKAQKVLSASEVEQLLVEGKLCEHHHYQLWAFALFTGMRNGEIYALRHSDINLETRLIHVTKQFTSKDGIHETKANRNRVVPISDELHSLLVELMQQGGHSETLWRWSDDQKSARTKVRWDDLLLPRHNDWRMGEQAAVLRNFCRAAGITEVKFHDLRATFITNLLAQGVPLTVVMKIVGHTKMATTDEYNRLAGVGVKGSTDRLGYKLPSEVGANVVSLFN